MKKYILKIFREKYVDRSTRWMAVSFVFFLLFLFPFYPSERVLAQSLEQISIPSSWNPVGSGARALGMGGAFIAIADDATAASWNPGGLIQLETPEISIVGSYFSRQEDYTFGTNPEATGKQSTSSSDLNYASFAYPFSLFNRNMIVAVTHQNLFDFNRDAKFKLSQSSGLFSVDRNIDINHEGNLSASGLSYSIELTQEVSLGFTLNFWEDLFGNHGWQETSIESNTEMWGEIHLGTSNYLIKKNFSFSGVNANIGFLWRVNNNLTLGGVFKTPFTADLDIETTTQYDAPSTTSKEKTDLEMPASYGIGISYRFSDAFSLAADIYRTEWQDFLLKRESGTTSPITGLSESESDIDPTTQVRLGFEYLFIKPHHVIPLRGGLFYDPAPAPGSPDKCYGVSLGSGIAWKNLIFDIAYQYRWGNNLGSHLYSDLDFSYNLREHSIFSSLIIHF